MPSAISRFMFGFLITVTAGSYGQSVSTDEVVRRVIDWEMSVYSFSGSYILTQHKLAEVSLNVLPDPMLVFRDRIVCRWDRIERNIYYERSELVGMKDRPKGEVISVYNGITNTLELKHSSEAVSTLNIKGRSGLPFPWGGFLLPEEIIGGYDGGSLSDVFSSGTSYLSISEDAYVLSHLNDTLLQYVDITLTKEFVIRKIEWVTRPPKDVREALASSRNGNMLEFRQTRRTLSFDEVDLLDGIVFPTIVTKTWWLADKEYGREIAQKLDVGEISMLTFYELMYSRPSVVFMQQTLELESAQLNIPLQEKDFKIDFPWNTVHYEHEKQPGPGGVPVPEPSFARRVFPYVSGVFLILLSAFLLWKYIKQ